MYRHFLIFIFSSIISHLWSQADTPITYTTTIQFAEDAFLGIRNGELQAVPKRDRLVFNLIDLDGGKLCNYDLVQLAYRDRAWDALRYLSADTLTGNIGLSPASAGHYKRFKVEFLTQPDKHGQCQVALWSVLRVWPMPLRLSYTFSGYLVLRMMNKLNKKDYLLFTLNLERKER